MSLYVLNRCTKFYENDENIIKYIWDYHFTDYLCQIVYFSVCNILLDLANRKGIYTIGKIMAFSLLSCMAWEVCVGWLRSDAIADIKDCYAYLLGAITYYFIFRLLSKRKGKMI